MFCKLIRPSTWYTTTVKTAGVVSATSVNTVGKVSKGVANQLTFDDTIESDLSDSEEEEEEEEEVWDIGSGGGVRHGAKYSGLLERVL